MKMRTEITVKKIMITKNKYKANIIKMKIKMKIYRLKKRSIKMN